MSIEHPWWHDQFKIRYQLSVPAVVFGEDERIIIRLDDGLIETDTFFEESNKSRDDFEDIELLYYDELEDEWTVLPRSVERAVDSDGELTYTNVKFFRQEDKTGASSNYYLYTGNPLLTGIDYLRPNFSYDGFFDRPGFPSMIYDSLGNIVASVTSTEADFYKGISKESHSQIAVIGESPRFTVSRPTQDWDSGYSNLQNARASFVYSGEPAIMVYESGPDRGILKITSTSGSYINTTLLDTYSSTYQWKSVYLLNNIISRYGYSNEFVVTGDKSPSSSGYGIKIDAIIYSQYDLGTILTEELNVASNQANRYVIGK